VVWEQDLKTWQKRSLSGKHYVYFWADGVYCNVCMDDKQCLLVIVGVTLDGTKKIVAIEGGFRESESFWTQLLLDLKARGLKRAPQLAIGDGALGFWKALIKVYGQTRWQRCWVHKSANVLDKLPKSLQAKAKSKLYQIWQAAGAGSVPGSHYHCHRYFLARTHAPLLGLSPARHGKENNRTGDPGIDGLETHRCIIRFHPGQRAVITSGFPESERVHEARKPSSAPGVISSESAQIRR
jgi:hypothetical protein